MRPKLSIIPLIAAVVVSLALLGTPAFAAHDLSPAPEDAKVYFIAPKNGETLPQTFTAKFGLSGMGIAPAGVDRSNTGHHHLLIDQAPLPDLTEPLQVNEHIKHFGGGQTEAVLNLPPGPHTLQLLLGNAAHIPHDHPVISPKISITVK
ncbi:DUF4399 domain-containing protein [Lyngbya confervoides]|uniref:DUF4399 domain-containing protein n=1 Tax=Lyngbya confervoides BDU141951 TaxID=1574623 RepID=A0ABD4T470_9CYAN|nr:DUF4399 domain-containing protein [Lyngbya confervoides]MCM1983037.1 DUF4399 domain-containing protein [Lyngbya confervoides BDU141951]